MKKFLFEYRFGGAEWAFEIPARDMSEARERLKALAWATYRGEVVATIPVPGAGAVHRIFSAATSAVRWLRAA